MIQTNSSYLDLIAMMNMANRNDDPKTGESTESRSSQKDVSDKNGKSVLNGNTEQSGFFRELLMGSLARNSANKTADRTQETIGGKKQSHDGIEKSPYVPQKPENRGNTKQADHRRNSRISDREKDRTGMTAERENPLQRPRYRTYQEAIQKNESTDKNLISEAPATSRESNQSRGTEEQNRETDIATRVRTILNPEILATLGLDGSETSQIDLSQFSIALAAYLKGNQDVGLLNQIMESCGLSTNQNQTTAIAPLSDSAEAMLASEMTSLFGQLGLTNGDQSLNQYDAAAADLAKAIAQMNAEQTADASHLTESARTQQLPGNEAGYVPEQPGVVGNGEEVNQLDLSVAELARTIEQITGEKMAINVTDFGQSLEEAFQTMQNNIQGKSKVVITAPDQDPETDCLAAVVEQTEKTPAQELLPAQNPREIREEKGHETDQADHPTSSMVPETAQKQGDSGYKQSGDSSGRGDFTWAGPAKSASTASQSTSQNSNSAATVLHEFSAAVRPDAAQRSAAATPSQMVSRMDRQAFMDELAKSVKVLLTGEKSEMTLQLKPESLGKVALKIVTEQGVVSAKFLVDNEQAKQSLEQNLQTLKDSLNQQGLAVQECMVQVGGGETAKDGNSREFARHRNSRMSPGTGKIAADSAVFDADKRNVLRNRYFFEESSVQYSA